MLVVWGAIGIPTVEEDFCFDEIQLILIKAPLRRIIAMAPMLSALRMLRTSVRVGRRGVASVAQKLDLGLPSRYGHYIDGGFVEPAGGQYFDNVSPIDGQVFIQAARGSKADVDHAVRAATEVRTPIYSPTAVVSRCSMRHAADRHRLPLAAVL